MKYHPGPPGLILFFTTSLFNLMPIEFWKQISLLLDQSCFFLKIWAVTCPFLGPLVPLFWISGDVSFGFQSQSGLPYSHCGGERNVHSEIHVWCYTCQPLGGRRAAGPVPTYCCRGEVARIRTRALRISMSHTVGPKLNILAANT